MTNLERTLDEMRNTVEDASGSLATISEEESNRTIQADKWSRKELLGHLIDSAAAGRSG